MRLININEYDKKTMQLAKPIIDYKKRILLASGSTIHPKYMVKLKDIGIKSLIIEDAQSSGITLDEMMDMPQWVDAIAIVEEAFNHAKRSAFFSLQKLQQTVKKLIEEVQYRKAIVLIPTSMIDEALSLYAHSVNVTLLSLQIGKHLNYNQLQLLELGLGTILHDIGKLLTEDEMQHPQKGFSLLRENRELSIVSAHVAYQHHEMFDGTGYPRKIKENQIIEYAQICSVANDYDNMISKEDMPPHEALEQIMAFTDKKYSHKVVLAFTNGIISYPPGTHIQLNNGRFGIVTKVESHPHRPIVKVEGIHEELDLSEKSTLFIEKVFRRDVNSESN